MLNRYTFRQEAQYGVTAMVPIMCECPGVNHQQTGVVFNHRVVSMTEKNCINPDFFRSLPQPVQAGLNLIGISVG
jgi:hypothetical protein